MRAPEFYEFQEFQKNGNSRIPGTFEFQSPKNSRITTAQRFLEFQFSKYLEFQNSWVLNIQIAPKFLRTEIPGSCYSPTYEFPRKIPPLVHPEIIGIPKKRYPARPSLPRRRVNPGNWTASRRRWAARRSRRKRHRAAFNQTSVSVAESVVTPFIQSRD